MKETNFINNIKEGFYGLFYIWKREFKAIFKDKAVLTFLVVLPLFYPLLYAFIYTNEVVRDVPAVVVDHSNSKLSRDYIRKVDATPDVKIMAYCADIEEAKEYLKQREAYGIIYVPSEFSEKLSKGLQTNVTLFCDMSGLLYYKALVMANTAVSLQFNDNIKMEVTGTRTTKEEQVSAKPIKYQDVAIYNPANGFASFLIPAVLILLIQQTLLLGIGVAAGTDRENHRFKDLIPVNKFYNGTLRVVLGKGLGYFMVYILLALYVITVVPRLFNLPQIGQAKNLILFIIPYLSACVFFAMTASVAVRNRETSIIVFVFTSIPLIFISGISWPGAAIPDFWKYFSYIFPSTFGINGYVRLNSMGASLNEVSFEYKGLWIQAAFYFITTCFVYRYQIILSRKHIVERHRALKTKRESKKNRRNNPTLD